MLKNSSDKTKKIPAVMFFTAAGISNKERIFGGESA